MLKNTTHNNNLDEKKPLYTLVPDGIGRLTYSGINGAYVLEGYFVKGVATGFCRWIWHDGLVYEGHLKNFKCHGVGKKILPSGEVKEGLWENDKLITNQEHLMSKSTELNDISPLGSTIMSPLDMERNRMAKGLNGMLNITFSAKAEEIT